MKYQKLGLVIIIVFAVVLLFACDNPFWPEKVEKGPCAHNDFSSWVVVKSATCMEAGLEERTCVKCGYKESESIDIDANAHTFTGWNIIAAATCMDIGERERQCTGCEFPEVEDIAKNPSAHTGEWELRIQPTCKDEGLQARGCTGCGENEEQAVPTDANMHEWQQSEGTASTCIAKGSGKRKCDVCDKEETESEFDLDPNNHSWGEFTQTTPPNCTESGKKTRDCSWCSGTDAVIQEGDPSLGGHSFVGATLMDVIPATCISTGMRGRKCQRDGCSYHTNDQSIAALGHNLPTNWTQTTQANCLNRGLQTRTCQRSGCDHSVTQNQPAALGHDLTAWLKNSTTTCLEEKRTCQRTVSSVACTHFEERTLADHDWNGLWPRSGKLVKSCITKCKDNNDCTVKRTLDEEMVQIQGGTMPLDGTINQRNWGDHTITLSAFKMHKFEVTQDLYEAVTGQKPSSFANSPQSGERQEQRPVENMTWFDAVEFCIKLNERESLSGYVMENRTPAAGYPITSATVHWFEEGFTGYRLPTEAEWEYACRAGTTTTWSFGNTEGEVGNYAWFTTNGESKTHQVGLKTANPWGLFDMHGNVFEWCWDWRQDTPLATAAQTNPKGPVTGAARVMRGRSWRDSASDTRSANRNGDSPGNRNSNGGIRIVLSINRSSSKD